jgi:hypothetical protein
MGTDEASTTPEPDDEPEVEGITRTRRPALETTDQELA